MSLDSTPVLSPSPAVAIQHAPRGRRSQVYCCDVNGSTLLHVAAVHDPASGTAELTLSGELCPASAPTLARALDEIIAGGDCSPQITIDLGRLTLCSAAGIGVMAAAHNELQRWSGSVRLRGAHGVVARTLTITGMLPQLGENGPSDL